MVRFVIVFISLIFCADVSAQNRDTIVDGKPFKIHEVQPVKPYLEFLAL